MISYLSSKIKRGKSRIRGEGLIATTPIFTGEVVIDYTNGKGRFVDKKLADELWVKGIDYDIQIDDDCFFVGSDDEIEDADFLNHSCSPNCGIKEKLKIVAIRNIQPGEEITFDYAMSESYDYEIGCKCGSKNCRKTITGDDWELPDLQKRYKGFFSEYIQKKIDKLSGNLSA